MAAILDHTGKPIARPKQNRFGQLLARYDAAQTTDENMRHWSHADGLSADAANSPLIRTRLRNRSRYETANNSYCRSMVDTLAADVIGTGPRVQVHSGDEDVDRWIEHEFSEWCREVRLGDRLRTMRRAKAVDGETVAILTTRDKLPTPVKLFLRPVECDQLHTPLMWFRDNEIDGIRFDEDGEPLQYSILDHHPGGTSWYGMFDEAKWYPASAIVHLFRHDRPGQHRGIPELTPALPLFSQLRRFTLATLAAAETAADFAAVIQTGQLPGDGYSPDDSDGVTPETLDVFELAQRMVTVLPEGYQLSQVKAEHPTTTYGEFKREILAEAFAALCMPYNVGAHDSSGFNFASGKLDRLTYARTVSVERQEWDQVCNYRLFRAWFDEALLIPDYLPSLDGLPPLSQWNVVFHWDGLDDIDPLKAANARRTELETGQRSLPSIYADRGEDFETEMVRNAEALGLTIDDYRKRLADKLFGNTQVAQAPEVAIDD